ncbi:MAG: oxalyl-CoA decarboxylase [Acidobacteriota bacterium]
MSDGPLECSGSELVAQSLRSQNVDHLFGVVGFPVFGIAAAAQKLGISYLGFRNEQAASYAAGVVGYLTGRPGGCLAVSGPGMIHATAGLANAQANCWPMLLLGGANDSYQNQRGAFQEAPQIEAARPFSKWAARPDSFARVPEYVEQAVRTTIAGRPGAAYLDLPNDILTATGELPALPAAAQPPPPSAALAEDVDRALKALRSAKRPLVIFGKGAAYARAEREARQLIEVTGLPFLPTPMAKGLVPDDSDLSVASARSFALQNADLVLLVGARFNWILHFGRSPRFADAVRVVQIDLCAEEIGHSVPAEVGLVGDARTILGQLVEALEAEPWRFDGDEWLRVLADNAAQNRAAVDAMVRDEREPMGYYRALHAVAERLAPETILVNEGANTMDIGRTVISHQQPRLRLDAGTFGTMGIGLGSALAAAVAQPDRPVVAVLGDSAFGFSGMECEVACRYGLPIKVVVINNNGIGGGVSSLDPEKKPPTSVYTPNARYEKVMEAFGGEGYYVDSHADLGPVLDRALASEAPALVNVMIDPKAARKPQKFEWLTR